MKITATILLSVFSFLSAYSQTSASVSGDYQTVQAAQKNPDHVKSMGKNSPGSTMQVVIKDNGDVKKNIRDHHFTRHLIFAVLFFQNYNHQEGGAGYSDNTGATNKIDYYKGKSLMFK